ncbi:hypothetical protein CCYN74_220013 [Capnocytophaga cynodegmi]|uniref:Uncharacterized protein n=1 Tax=Capnocytophaga cynodegmi TaxID=28189 RepID=A0A0B7HDR0_9FLAO|nr:hypothetical protein CCYN74_220013 [Capnocytophaga cynodegmi]
MLSLVIFLPKKEYPSANPGTAKAVLFLPKAEPPNSLLVLLLKAFPMNFKAFPALKPNDQSPSFGRYSSPLEETNSCALTALNAKIAANDKIIFFIFDIKLKLVGAKLNKYF